MQRGLLPGLPFPSVATRVLSGLLFPFSPPPRAQVLRLYLGFSHVGSRLLSATVVYEETGWYDGQVSPPCCRSLQLGLHKRGVQALHMAVGHSPSIESILTSVTFPCCVCPAVQVWVKTPQM